MRHHFTSTTIALLGEGDSTGCCWGCGWRLQRRCVCQNSGVVCVRSLLFTCRFHLNKNVVVFIFLFLEFYFRKKKKFFLMTSFRCVLFPEKQTVEILCSDKIWHGKLRAPSKQPPRQHPPRCVPRCFYQTPQTNPGNWAPLSGQAFWGWTDDNDCWDYAAPTTVQAPP